MTEYTGAFGLTVREVGRESSRRILVTGVVEGDRLYRSDALEAVTERGRVTACVQAIRVGRRRVDCADPGQEVTLTLPGVKRDAVVPGTRFCRSALVGWGGAPLGEEIEFPVNTLLLRRARRHYLRLSPERRALRPVRIGGALTALLALFLIYRWTLTALSARTALGPGLDVTVALIAAAALAALTVFVTFRLGRRAALRRFFTGPARLTAEGLEIDGRPEESRNGELIRSEIAFADIDSLEYYPRLGCVRIGAPVCMTKFRDGAVVGTKYENSPERAFLTCFLVYIDNELFMRELSRRSGVPVETVSAGRPDADGTRF